MAPKGGTLQAQGALTALEPGCPALESVGHVLHPFLQPRRQALPSLCRQRPLPNNCGSPQEGHGANEAVSLVLEGCLHKHQGGCLAGKVQGPCTAPGSQKSELLARGCETSVSTPRPARFTLQHPPHLGGVPLLPHLVAQNMSLNCTHFRSHCCHLSLLARHCCCIIYMANGLSNNGSHLEAAAPLHWHATAAAPATAPQCQPRS